MKIKPSIIYILAFIILLIIVIVFSTSNKPESVDNGIPNSQMPNDSIHSQMKMNISQDFKKMMDKLKKRADENPNDTAAIREYALILADAHRTKDAIPYFEKILKIDPKRLDVMFSLTFAHFNLKEYEIAEKYTNNILSINGNNLQAQFNLGAIAAAKGDKEKAAKIWNKLIEKNPKSETAQIAKSALEKLNQK